MTLYKHFKLIEGIETAHKNIGKILEQNKVDFDYLKIDVEKELNKTLKEIRNQSLIESIKTLEVSFFTSTKETFDSTSKFIPIMKEGAKNIYERNPIFQDALNGKTVYMTLEELSTVNAGIKKYLPRRKNPEHNKKLKNIGELIDTPLGLSCNGILSPDNFVTAGIYTAAFMYMFVSTVVNHSAVYQNTNNAQAAKLVKDIIPIATPLTIGSIAGLGLGHERLKSIEPFRKQAIYVDDKIKEFYLNKKE